MYRVQKIIGKRENRKKKGKFEYLVKWQGWDAKDSTWEPEKHLEYVQDLVQEYQQANRPQYQYTLESSSLSSMQIADDYSIGTTKKTKSQRGNNYQMEKSERKKKKIQHETVSSLQQVSQGEQEHQPQTMEEFKSACQATVKETSKTPEVTTTHITEPEAKAEKTKEIKIVGMKKEGSQYWYYVSEKGGNQSWVVRDYMIRHYPVRLIQFYEERIVFGP